MSTDRYTSPLSERYASSEMQYIFSQDMKFKTWRRLWIALAEIEKDLGFDFRQVFGHVGLNDDFHGQSSSMRVHDGFAQAAGFEQREAKQDGIADARPQGFDHIRVHCDGMNQYGVDRHTDDDEHCL